MYVANNEKVHQKVTSLPLTSNEDAFNRTTILASRFFDYCSWL